MIKAQNNTPKILEMVNIVELEYIPLKGWFDFDAEFFSVCIALSPSGENNDNNNRLYFQRVTHSVTKSIFFVP